MSDLPAYLNGPDGQLSDLIDLKAPCCGRMLRGAKLYLVATTNVRRSCCGQRWSITIRPVKGDPYRGIAVHQIDWERDAAPALPPTWESKE